MTDDTDEGARSVSVSRVIPASPQALFDVVADPTLHHVIDGSGTVRGTRSASRKLGPGDRFATSMRIGLPYVSPNRVVEFDEPRSIAWAHVGGHRWRYEFEPVEGGTRVTETFDWSTMRGGALGLAYIERLRWPQRHVPNMARTLERLEAFVTNRAAAV